MPRLKRIACLVLMASPFLLLALAYAEEAALKLRFSLNGAKPDAVYTVTASGRVLDNATNRPIEGAVVRGYIVVWQANSVRPDLFDTSPYLETNTNANGEYQLKFETPLTASGAMKGKDGLCVDAGAAGYETRPVYAKERVTPRKTDFPQLDIRLEKGKEVQGILVDDSGKAVSGATVSIQSGFNGDWSFFHSLGSVTSDATGKFRITCSTDRQLVSDNPWLQVSMPGYGVGFYFDLLKKGDLGTLVLPRGGEIRGKVVAADGRGLANCEVLAFSPWGERWHTRTDSAGAYVLSGVHGEETIKAFAQRKNGSYDKILGTLNVFARANSEQSLGDSPTFQIVAQDGKTVTAPDLVVGNLTGVSGKLLPAPSSPALQGLLVRLDGDWDKMVEADGEGSFSFASVPAGKHRLTAYLPTNLRYDRGIGRTEIDVKPQQKLDGITIQLDELAEARVQILDIQGAPLEGITAGATWNRNGTGAWTEGSRSGPDGWAVLYLHPDDTQYIRGMDMESHALAANGYVEVKPKAGEVIDNLRVTMVAVAKIRLLAVNEQGQPMKEKALRVSLNYADGTEQIESIKTGADGRIELAEITPGAIKIGVKTQPLELAGSTESLTEIKPGETKDYTIVMQASAKGK